MKKHISINISGIIFHVEEDAFELLKAYLNEITKHFSTYAGSEDIMSDIELRIAEFFLDRLSAEKEQLTYQDVQDLKQVMGTVTDSWEDRRQEEEHQTTSFHELTKDAYTKAKKAPKLYRDENRRVIGGVASGIAHYFNINPLWVRLVFLMCLLDFGGLYSMTGFATAIYIALWVSVPGAFDLEVNENLKRLFRDPENKVLGGVASGLASYFHIDPTVIRVIFVLSAFAGGIGLLPYIVIWIITPEAKSLTERMQMKGEPINLANIEDKIRESLNFEKTDESTLAKILLLPFKLISMAVQFIETEMVGSRYLAKGSNLLLFLLGSSMVFGATVASIGLFAATAAFLGLPFAAQMLSIDDIPIELIHNTVPVGAVLFTFLVAWIPIVYVGVAGMSIASRRIVTKAWLNWGLLVVWIIGVVGASVTVPMFAVNFQTEGIHKEVQAFNAPNSGALRLMVKAPSYSNYDFYRPQLTIIGHEGAEVQLEQRFEAKGCSRQVAINHASSIVYDVEHRDSTLIFSPYYNVEQGEPFRVQELKMTLSMPYGQEFVLAKETKNILRNTIYRNGYTIEDLKMDNRWVFETDGLHCLTCKPATASNSFEHEKKQKNGKYTQTYQTAPLTSISVEGIGRIIIRQGNEASVYIEGDSKEAHRIRVNVSNQNMNIRNRYAQNAVITIVQPSLENINIEGPLQIDIEDYRQENLTIRLTEASSLNGHLYIENLNLNISEASNIVLRGAGANVNMHAKEGANINTEEMAIENLAVTGREGAHISVGSAANVQIDLDEGSVLNRDND